jgi:hypothetical protein
MHTFLSHDSETGELRLVYTDLWRGQHERTEYRVTATRGGDVVRNRPDLDGWLVRGNVPGLYIRKHVDMPVWAQEVPVGETVKTPCPRAANARRKCSL